jgi:glucans biosynthesis protein
MHGGAKGSGAPVGNRNAWKHGGRSGEHLEQIRRFREVLAGARAVADVL